MTLDYDGFQQIELVWKADDHNGCVYILIFSKDGLEIPFYVGQTARFFGRMDDYFWASFQAATDFKVGEAIRHFCGLTGSKVLARYKMCAKPRTEEARVIAQLREQGAVLLNGELGYDYKAADEQKQATEVRMKCDAIIAAAMMRT